MRETLAEQFQGESHEKPSTEEDDQKSRSNKKIKTGEEHEPVEMDVSDKSTLPSSNDKPSYRDKDSCPKALVVAQSNVVTAEQTAEGDIPVLEGNQGDGSEKAVSAKNEAVISAGTIPKIVENEFGPWMVVQRPQRKKLCKEKVDEHPENVAKDSNKFQVLLNDMHEDAENLNNARVENVTPIVKQVRRGLRPNGQKSTKFGPPKPKSNLAASHAIQSKPQLKVLANDSSQKDSPHADQVSSDDVNKDASNGATD
ncbi:hypothetical protein RIF29_24333 [Crotalaria pallida]|uniref:Uncharacterized protein n=1 Tax=Crotalaria pallida TaxID=3830 RepID=A0AAN9EK74_CROPI